MGKIVLNRTGDLRSSLFFRFDVQSDDDFTLKKSKAGLIIAPRTPSNDALIDAGQPGYVQIEELPKREDRVETKDCPVNTDHVTHRWYKAPKGDAAGYSRLSPFLKTNGLYFAISLALCERLRALSVKGAQLDPFKIIVNQSHLRELNVWALQFVGRAKLRQPVFTNIPNSCPHCGKGQIVCQSCGEWTGQCPFCQKQMVVSEFKHEGKHDKRIQVEEGLRSILEVKNWDGSDLVQAGFGCYASKRFIDWLLRVHAAPFYAEPVYFCVDGMNDQQKKWFDDLQKPFDV